MARGMNMNAMMKQAQKMQNQINKVQDEISKMEHSYTAGGGMVKATVRGDGRVMALEINPIVADPNDVEMLQDLVIAAINGGFDELSEIGNAKMAQVTGGMNIPGLM